jgi:hypothetical protein
MDLDMQLRLFKEALTEVGDGDLINQVLEVYLTEEGDLHILRYRLPAD